MEGTLFERYVFNVLSGALAVTLSLLSLGLHALGTPFPYVVTLCLAGITSFTYAYVCVWPRFVPTREQLVKDLRLLGYVVPLERCVGRLQWY